MASAIGMTVTTRGHNMMNATQVSVDLDDILEGD